MAHSFDAAVSSLLCAEDNKSVLNDDFDYENHRNHRTNNQNLNLDFEVSFNGLQMQSDECLEMMIEKECEHLPCVDYLNKLRNGDLDLRARNEVVDWIGKAHAHFSFGPLSLYLSINYLDRFLSAYELPKGKAWMMQLLGVACFSLAAKMEETEVPLSLDLQVGDSKFVFEARTIQRMELLVLSKLKWRMQTITPFSFVDYFLTKINGDQTPPRSSILTSTQLILIPLRGIDLLEFKPSEIAAAVAMLVSAETQTVDTEKAISVLIQHVQKERILKCVEVFNRSALTSGGVKGPSGSVQSVPQSPIGVLEAACLSYKTDETTTLGSCPNSSHSSPNTNKRRRLN